MERSRSDVDHALELAAAQSIDLLLTDMVMPKMNGAELAARVRAKQPNARVLLMSGYAEGAARARPADPWLIKPFSPVELGRRVHEVLSRKCSPSVSREFSFFTRRSVSERPRLRI